MKKKLTLTFFVALLALSVEGQIGTIKYLNERNGYKSIKLGDTITSVSPDKITPIQNAQNPDFKYYNYNDENILKLSDDVQLDKVVIQTYKGRIYSIKLFFNAQLGILIKGIFDKGYGVGDQPNQFMERYMWFSDKAALDLNYNANTSQGYAEFNCIPLLKQFVSDQGKVAQKAANGL